MSSIYTPYTYLIGWSKHQKFYYGVRYGKNCHPSDLWISYFTSSKHVKKFRLENGEPDVIVIRKTFDTSEKARNWEDKVLKKMKVIFDDKWLNRSYGKDAFYNKKLSDEHKNKISISKTGKKHSEETKRKISLNSAVKREPLSEEQKVKISQSMIGMKRPKISCSKCGVKASASNISRWHGEKCKNEPVLFQGGAHTRES